MTEKDSTVLVDPLGGLLLEPSNELRFKGPFDDFVSVSLSIRNPTEKRIAFKIKTTAPKRYCVKPNSGVLDPSQSMKVNVLLQPFNYDPNEKNKHKFMVQYMYLNDTEMLLAVNDILNMWKDVPASRLLDLKLKCLFEFNESDQAKMSNSSSTAAGGADKIEKSSSMRTSTSKPNETYVQASDLHSNDFESTYSSTSKQQAAANQQLANANLNTNSNNSSASSATSVAASQSSAAVAAAFSTASSNLISAASRLDKNDNTLNELKLLRQENDSLKKEINRLKEEESRLRKLALQAPSSSLNQQRTQTDSLAELLNNRSTLIIIVLIAIVIYLLLFR